MKPPVALFKKKSMKLYLKINPNKNLAAQLYVVCIKGKT